MNKKIERLKTKKITKIQQQIYKTLIKQYKTRRFIIKEIYETELKYVEDLKLIFELVVDKYTNQYGIDKSKQLFSNLKEIIDANQWLLDKLASRIESENVRYQNNYKLQKELKNQYGHENSVLFNFENDQQLLSKFECYYLYCGLYMTNQQSRKKEIDENQYFKNLLNEAESNPAMNSNRLEDFLIKPIQRLPKYILLLKDLKKNTPNKQSSSKFRFNQDFEHPDYKNICNMLEQFEKINDKNNEKIGKLQNIQKMIEIQKQYGNDRLIIHNGKREFIFEETLEFYVNAYQRKNIQLLCFSDAILLIEVDYSAIFGARQKCIAMSEFSLASEFSRIDSKQGLLFKVTTKQKVFIFIANDIQQLEKIEKLLEGTFNKFIQEKKRMLDESGGNSDIAWDQLQIKVCIEGTEEYNLASLQNYTVYIIKLVLKDIEWKIYLRYSQVQKIYQYITSHDFNANVLKLQSSNWLRSHNNKYLDSLKINIEGFIQSIFQWKKFEKYKSQILMTLGLPTNFNILPKFMGSQNNFKIPRSQSILNESQDSIDQLAEKLNQQFLEELKISHLLKTYISQSDEKIVNYSIKVILPRCIEVNENIINNPNNKVESWVINNKKKQSEIVIRIDNLSKAIELCEIIAKAIQLQEFYDFRLFVTDQRGNLRSLENNQIVMQSVPPSKTIFPNLSFQLSTIFDESYQLEFLKYIFFPQTIEQYLYRQDQTRLKLLVEQFLKETKTSHLNLQTCSTIYSLYILIYKDIDFKKKDSIQVDQNILRTLFFAYIRKSQTQETWNLLVNNQFAQIQPEIQNLVRLNEKQVVEQNYEIKQYQIFTTIQNLARITMLNLSFSLSFWGVAKFYVSLNVNEETNIYLKQNKNFENSLPNIYLGISYKMLQLLSPGRKKELCSFSLIQIKNITVEPLYIFINILLKDEQREIKLKFKTIEGYKILQLIKELQNLIQQNPQLSQFQN